MAIAPYKSKGQPINPSKLFAVTINTTGIATPAQGAIILTLFDSEQAAHMDSLDATVNTQTVNLGNAAGNGSATLLFPARRFQVQNTGGFYIYISFGTLTPPAVNNAQFIVPPYCYYTDEIVAATLAAWTITASVAPLATQFNGMNLLVYDKP